jgi:hypothetical protein
MLNDFTLKAKRRIVNQMLASASHQKLACACVLMLLGGCSHEIPEPSSAMLPSELNADASRYDGQEITVRGYATLMPEAHNLVDSYRIMQEWQQLVRSGTSGYNPNDYKKYCLTIANPDFFRHGGGWPLNGRTVTLRGKFLANYLDDRSIDLGACPLRTGIIVDKVL